MKTLLSILTVLLVLYFLICLLAYFFQEKLIFFPEVLAKDYRFGFKGKFEEHFVEMKDGKKLHALLFKAEKSKGVVFYLHGNAGSLDGWGAVANAFTDLNYDVFIPDYRGYGKSEGSIKSEAQLHRDIHSLYEFVNKEYPENHIIVLGHSIGSGMATKVASENNPKLLILQAPFYSIPDVTRNTTPLQIFPAFLLKYKFRNGKYLRKVRAPVVILHGEKDEIIYYGSSLKLKHGFKPGDTLITLKGYGHNNFLGSKIYRKEIENVLRRLY